MEMDLLDQVCLQHWNPWAFTELRYPQVSQSVLSHWFLPWRLCHQIFHIKHVPRNDYSHSSMASFEESTFQDFFCSSQLASCSSVLWRKQELNMPGLRLWSSRY